MNPDDPLKPFPHTRVNPNLSRDVLSVIFAKYHADVERVRKDATVPTADGPVSVEIARDALSKYMKFRICSVPGCNRYKLDMIDQVGFHRHRKCDACPGVIIVKKCKSCRVPFCASHLFELEVDDGRGWTMRCFDCLKKSGCLTCVFKPDITAGRACTGFKQALEVIQPIGQHGTIVHRYTCTHDWKVV